MLTNVTNKRLRIYQRLVNLNYNCDTSKAGGHIYKQRKLSIRQDTMSERDKFCK